MDDNHLEEYMTKLRAENEVARQQRIETRKSLSFIGRVQEWWRHENLKMQIYSSPSNTYDSFSPFKIWEWKYEDWVNLFALIGIGSIIYWITGLFD